ncbi:Arf-domain-containing protein [Microstroma glucosiphilum]|uniref:Arf-domain-containing protein n=1 Tax=Pseudomicrostroma glucosiphilum TaxID=1684307 RepID=A0A316U0U3_9BASI|nr:Arf-domain-containing protein [Pseudomicrostroma glucosiphilum]PWN19022.1 Arf-domain-containing protein [Pseudomicrostroma glucosiphilum]
MGLLTIIRKSAHRERQLRLLFLGLDNSGKSTILKRLLHSPDWDRLSPTLGFDIVSLSHPPYTLNIWDIGGQRTLRPYWRNYFERTDALVWVVDSGDRTRMKECREELWELMVREERLATCSLLVLANKQDLPGAMSSEEIREVLGLEELLRVRGGGEGRILPCSAVKEMGYQEGLQWVVEDCEQRLYWSNAVDRHKKLEKAQEVAVQGETEDSLLAGERDASAATAIPTS